MGQKILEMIENKDADLLFRIVHAFQTRFQALDDRAECMLLDEEEQPLFGLKVVIKSSQRHAAGARKVAHRGALVSLFAEDFGGVGENLRQPPVKARGRWDCSAVPPSPNPGCC